MAGLIIRRATVSLSSISARWTVFANGHTGNKGCTAAYSSDSESARETTQAPEVEVDLNYLDGDKEGIVVLSMRRFRYKNAMGRNLMKQFLEGLNQIKFDTAVRVVILRSEVPGVFCAGADLKERAEMTNEEVTDFVKMLRFSTSELAALPTPSIAAIDGAALGGGLEMALGCDLRVAASNARIGLIETSRGLLPGAGGSQRLPRIIGVPRAKELMFTSRRLDAYQAERMGVVNQAVEQNAEGTAAYQRALELAEEILPNGPIALRMAKLAINQGSEVDINSGLKYEEAYYAQVIPTKDRIEGLMAFKEKRKPMYKGH